MVCTFRSHNRTSNGFGEAGAKISTVAEGKSLRRGAEIGRREGNRGRVCGSAALGRCSWSPCSNPKQLQKARDDALGRMKLSQKRVSELNGELAQYGACDPVQVEEKRRAVVLAHEAATRWTGRTFAPIFEV
jgi:hypothetical protein